MNFSRDIVQYATKPLSYHLVRSLLTKYKRPNDKINELVKQGMLTPLKKGLYIAGPMVPQKTEPFLIANYLWGPSYVSLDSALSWYSLIPERVFGISSVSLKPSRTYSNPAGRFDYVHIDLPYYAFGLRQLQLPGDQFAMIASPEKAIWDRIVTTSGITFRSPENALNYIIEDMRIDESQLRELDISEMESWLSEAPKKNSLFMFLKALKQL